MQVSPPTAPGPQMLPIHYLLLLSQGLNVAQAGLNVLYKGEWFWTSQLWDYRPWLPWQVSKYHSDEVNCAYASQVAHLLTIIYS